GPGMPAGPAGIPGQPGQPVTEPSVRPRMTWQCADEDAEPSRSTTGAATRDHTEEVTVESDAESFDAAVTRADQAEEQGAESSDCVMAETGRDDDRQECQCEESKGPQPPTGSPFLRRPHRLRGVGFP